MTVDGFRRRFQEARREADEGGLEYLSRTSRYLLRWIQLAEIDDTFEALFEMLVKEEFLTTCEPGLSVHLRDKGKLSMDELGGAADRYLETRRNMSAAKKVPRTPDQEKGRGTTHVAERSGEARSRANGSHQPSRNGNKCYICSKTGHIARDCRHRFKSKEVNKTMAANACWIEEADMEANKVSLESEVASRNEETLLGFAAIVEGRRNLFVYEGRMGDLPVKVMRDTGCTGAVVRKSLVGTKQLTGEWRRYRMLDGTQGTAPVARIELESPCFAGELEALCLEKPLYDIIVGNIQGVVDVVKHGTPPDETRDTLQAEAVGAEGGECHANAVVTRAQGRKKLEPYKGVKVAEPVDLRFSPAELKRAQREDASLKQLWDKEASKTTVNYSKGTSATMEQINGILHQRYLDEMGKSMKQIIVPSIMRKEVMSLAHDTILTGHLGMGKTCDRILAEFYWPGVTADVARFCRSCEVCQRTVPKGRVSRAPLQKMPTIGTPFDRVAVDLVGPIKPASEAGNRYVLTLVDYATRYPEAIALPSIEAKRVAEGLVKIYTRMGIPREILSDQGTQFMSGVMSEVSRLLSVKHVTSSPYNPQCNGLCERFNGTLKQIIRKLCAERPTDWDRYLEAVLFAYREVPQGSLGFSPFELLYGRTFRGPMAILRELWTKDIPEGDVKTTYQYVVDLRNRIEETCRLAQESLAVSQGKAKKHFDAKARMRTLEVGDQVLLLRPTSNNKLLLHWKGPFTVTDKTGPTDYRILIGGKEKVYHINLLKRYYRRQTTITAAALVLEESGDDEDSGTGRDQKTEISVCENKQKETYKNADINPALEEDKREQLMGLLHAFQDIFSDVPGSTDLGEHRIHLLTDEPVRAKPYPLPYNMRAVVEKEVTDMIKLGVIEPTNSPYSSPLHLVKKKDCTYRPVVDFRNLNHQTVFDTEPMPNVEKIYTKLAHAKVMSKLDFTKGYWQVPMAGGDKQKTAFTCSSGTFLFTKMPFELVNSGATFNRIMRKLLSGQEHVDSFVDDVLAYTKDLGEHIAVLEQVFQRIREARLTVKPSKCSFGYE